MPLDDVTFDYGGHGMPEKLTLKGVYKHQVQGPADYCAFGTINGQEVLLSERTLLSFTGAAENEGYVSVPQVERAGKNVDPVELTLGDIDRALKHIDVIAPNDRPDPLVSVA